MNYGALLLPDGSIEIPFENIEITCEADLLAYWKGIADGSTYGCVDEAELTKFLDSIPPLDQPPTK